MRREDANTVLPSATHTLKSRDLMNTTGTVVPPLPEHCVEDIATPTPPDRLQHCSQHAGLQHEDAATIVTLHRPLRIKSRCERCCPGPPTSMVCIDLRSCRSLAGFAEHCFVLTIEVDP